MAKIYALMTQQPKTARGAPLGLFSQLVMGAILQLQETNQPAYGLRITEHLMAELNTLIDPGQVYLTLKRLADRNLVRKDTKRADKATGAVTEYSVLPAGEQAFAATDLYVQLAAKFSRELHAERSKGQRRNRQRTVGVGPP